MLDAPVDWVVSYPKSGNTWVKLLLERYFTLRGNCPQLFADTGEHFYHLASPIPLEDLSVEEQVALRPAVVMYAKLLLGSHWYLAKSHQAAEVVRGLPMFSRAIVRKAIYVVRDPRDIVISLADHIGKEIEDALRVMNTEGATLRDSRRATHYLGTWSRHVESWMEAKDFPVALIHYERLHQDAEGVLGQLVEFLGEESPDQELIEEAVEYCHIDNLRKLEAEGEIDAKSEFQDTFFRRGVAQGWRTELDDHYIEIIERFHGSVMKGLGYKVGEPVRRLEVVS